MQEPADYELNKTELPPPAVPPARTRSLLPWIAAVVAAIAAIGLAWYFAAGRQTAATEEGTSVRQDAAAPATPDGPLGVAAEPIDLPPLDQTDALVRRLVGDLSSHPRVAAWLATDGLVRRFTVATENIAGGAVPAQALAPLRPGGRFTVIDTGTALRVDPRSYDRYNALAAAVDSVDPAGAARLYTLLKPRIDEAHAELGGNEPFDRTLERAIVMLLRAPVLESVQLDPKGVVYAYADPAVERLTAAQKQLTRMGPANARIIQRRLREIGLALGIPPERLPL